MNNLEIELEKGIIHKPVLLNEMMDYLNIKEDSVYVDCTLGLGGHSLEILKHLNGRGILIGIEKDLASLEIAKVRLKAFKNCYLFHCDFLEIKAILKNLNIDNIRGGVLLDLGVNSLQLNTPHRGFSFNKDAPLDMRMDTRQSLTARKIINTYSESKLRDIIFNFGEERFSKKIAKYIIEKRIKQPIKTTGELAEIVLKAYPKNKWFKIHPATRTFQAIRIEVNQELKKLEQFFCIIPELLLPKSRLTVISFHSLEDRITKNFLRGSKEFITLTKKPVVPSQDELEKNPRARSAKLRAAEKI